MSQLTISMTLQCRRDNYDAKSSAGAPCGQRSCRVIDADDFARCAGELLAFIGRRKSYKQAVFSPGSA